MRVFLRVGALLGSALLLAGVLAAQPSAVGAAGQDHGGDVDRVLQLTNAERRAAGVPPLALSPDLSAAAENYSQVLASGTCFEHTCGAVPNFADRLGQAGYIGWTAIAENIAAGYPTPDAVVAGWMASPGHRANILSADYRELGVGVVSGGPHGTYWTQEFGARPAALHTSAPSADDSNASGAMPALEDAEPQSGQ